MHTPSFFSPESPFRRTPASFSDLPGREEPPREEGKAIASTPETAPLTVLLLISDPALRTALAGFVEEKGARARASADIVEVLRSPQSQAYELCLVEASSDGRDGLPTPEQAVTAIRAQDPRVEIVILAAPGEASPSVIALGARAVLPRPIDLGSLDGLLEAVREECAARREIGCLDRELTEKFTFEGMVSRSPAMLRVIRTIRAIAPYHTTVLLTGETGTGKELAARAVHRLSARATRAFVTSNCAALPESLAETELFGHVRGAFTGAVSQRTGVFERAHGGTLFLDEVGELTSALQAKLLRVVQQGEVQKVGAHEPIQVDVRLIAATNRDLRAEVAGRGFREDLFYRLSVLEIQLPPLRDRREDIPLLYRRFLADFNERFHKHVRGFSHRAQEVMLRWSWPGNVRELRNVIERACLLTPRDFVDLDELPPYLLGAERGAPGAETGLDRTLAEVEHDHIRRVLEACAGNRSEAARRLGVSRRTLQRKLLRVQSRGQTRAAASGANEPRPASR